MHLYYKGFDELYTVWTSHGDTYSHVRESSESDINPYKRMVVEGFGPEFQKFQPIFYKQPPNLDAQTLMFIIKNNMRPPSRQNHVEKKGCYNNGAKDHWKKECPFEKTTTLKIGSEILW